MFGIDINPWSLIAKAVICAALMAGAAYAMHKFDHGTYADLELKYAQAQEKVLEQSIELTQKDLAISTAAAKVEEIAQVQIVDLTTTITQEVPVYVKDNSTCVTVGLVRVLSAAARGIDPATLPLAAGQSNDTCAALGSTALANNVVANYGIARANAEQLNALELTILQLQAPVPSSPGHATPSS